MLADGMIGMIEPSATRDPSHAQTRIDHAVCIAAHAAGADRVIADSCSVADVLFPAEIIDGCLHRENPALHVARKAGAAIDTVNHLQPGNQRRHIARIAQQPMIDDRCIGRIRTAQPNFATAARLCDIGIDYGSGTLVWPARNRIKHQRAELQFDVGFDQIWL